MDTAATQAEDRKPVLELEDVDVPSPGNAEVPVLRSVDWKVGEGEAWLVSGPPGGGKTSVLTVAAGLVRPVRGRQKVFGADLRELTESEQVRRRARLGFVFGGGGRLFTGLSVLENLMLPLRYHGARSEEWLKHLRSMVEELELEPHLSQVPRELPRRVAQRVALARALVMDPEVLLLDDPAAGMELADQEWWVDFVCATRERRRPATIVVAATDARPWTRLSAHVAVVRRGRWEVTEAKREGAGLRPAGEN